ncbi:LysM peptidoglycan-binding domain-containing protein [Parvularcula sp. LCG005]|uniref:LysM peptidoglycan-binding domain-containing protein n=1 Tax=Parvularcula sp. LCG005 TaxID=3078805 RepID=UPI0029423270|nr:LysM peptidoglycan-binding domain-containing protein [Parvularcula sp. LCG005]WOI54381.1 LysM peptidoglycan-binding domain-containing protein [Parvularcula sp. LCG005]
MRTLLLVVLIVAAAILIYLFTQRQFGTEEEVSRPGVEDTTPNQADGDSEEQEALSLPRFDIVRVDRTGFAVIAGLADAESTVELTANGEVIATETAGPDGSWAISTDTPLREGPVELGLRMTTPDGMTVISEQTVIIYVPEREGDNPVILRTTPGGATEVLQRASDPVGALGPLSILSIDYDDGGNVILAGVAEPRSVVQVFADKQPVGQVSADDDGRWELSATIRPGRYTLQIIQLGPDGAPRYAIEVPFEQASLADVQLRDGNVIVQPGNNLWLIARTVYGTGFQYTVIYQENADQIRDPDLIYPGQVFRLPEEEGEDAGDQE